MSDVDAEPRVRIDGVGKRYEGANGPVQALSSISPAMRGTW